MSASACQVPIRLCDQINLEVISRCTMQLIDIYQPPRRSRLQRSLLPVRRTLLKTQVQCLQCPVPLWCRCTRAYKSVTYEDIEILWHNLSGSKGLQPEITGEEITLYRSIEEPMRKFPYNHSDGPCGEITLPSVCRSMRKFLHAFISNSQKLVRTNPTRSESRRVTIKVAQIHQGSRRMTVKVAQIHQGSRRFIKIAPSDILLKWNLLPSSMASHAGQVTVNASFKKRQLTIGPDGLNKHQRYRLKWVSTSLLAFGRSIC